jgi:PhnB protein
MKGCALFIESESVDDAERLFERMSGEGLVTVPFKKQFWGDTYGNFTDKFGVQWAILCPAKA